MPNLNCRDGFCGALDCTTCYGDAALRYRLQYLHESHEHPEVAVDDCEECQAEIAGPDDGLDEWDD
jgi:hypothetical protein